MKEQSALALKEHLKLSHKAVTSVGRRGSKAGHDVVAPKMQQITRHPRAQPVSARCGGATSWNISPALVNARSAARRHPRQRHTAVRCLALPEAVFAAATFCVIPVYTLLVAAPQNAATKRFMTSRWPYYAAAVAYAVLIAFWNPLPQLWDAFRAAALAQPGPPDVTAFAALFTRPEATALVWVHLLTLDLFQAR